jgi:hypothetical protein
MLAFRLSCKFGFGSLGSVSGWIWEGSANSFGAGGAIIFWKIILCAADNYRHENIDNNSTSSDCGKPSDGHRTLLEEGALLLYLWSASA